MLEELERRGEFSCSFVRDLLERIHRFDLVEKLAEPFHNGEESCIKESYSPQESKQLNEVVESVSGVNSKQCDEVEEGKEIFDNTEVDEEDEVCNNSNVNSFNSDSEGASVTFPAKNVNESSFVGGVDLSEERYDSASSLQINQPIHFNGSGFTSDLTGSTRPELTHSATDTHRDSDFSGSASMLPSTRNSGLSVSSSVCKQTYGFPPDASSTSSSGARVNGSDSRLFSESESSRVSQLLPVTTGRDGLNTSEEVNSSSNAMNASGDHLASGHYREGSRAYNSSSSHMISGTDTGESQSGETEDSVTNRNYGTESVESTDNSLLELEQRVEEACAMVERVLREREEREEFGREIERKEREIRAERARKKREREARELEEARGWPQQQEPVTGQSLWLCEHYQRHCRVRFPCCNNFYSCHRCHNNSKECDNEEAKASHATHLKCNYCYHEQEVMKGF